MVRSLYTSGLLLLSASSSSHPLCLFMPVIGQRCRIVLGQRWKLNIFDQLSLDEILRELLLVPSTPTYCYCGVLTFYLGENCCRHEARVSVFSGEKSFTPFFLKNLIKIRQPLQSFKSKLSTLLPLEHMKMHSSFCIIKQFSMTRGRETTMHRLLLSRNQLEIHSTFLQRSLCSSRTSP